MPAARTARRPRLTHKPKPGSRPLPRITDPYAPRDPNKHLPESPAEKRAEERSRIAANKKVCRLAKIHERSKAVNMAIVDPVERGQANWATELAHRSAQSDYEDHYGKFVPDAENAAWFARKKLRVEEMNQLRDLAAPIDDVDHIFMVIYLNRAEAFKEDFGHGFSAYDGCNEHFAQMASYSRALAGLRQRNRGNLTAMLVEARIPRSFTVSNPYVEGDQRRVDFDAKLRVCAQSWMEPDIYAALPVTPIDDFPFTINNINEHQDLTFWVLLGYCHVLWMENYLLEMSFHHWEALHDCIGEYSELNSPFVPRAPLW